jgi:hypothetical protein
MTPGDDDFPSGQRALRRRAAQALDSEQLREYAKALDQWQGRLRDYARTGAQDRGLYDQLMRDATTAQAALDAAYVDVAVEGDGGGMEYGLIPYLRRIQEVAASAFSQADGNDGSEHPSERTMRTRRGASRLESMASGLLDTVADAVDFLDERVQGHE